MAWLAHGRQAPVPLHRGEAEEHDHEDPGDEGVTHAAAVAQLLANDFQGAEERLRADVRASPWHALLFAQIAFARAVLSRLFTLFERHMLSKHDKSQ